MKLLWCILTTLSVKNSSNSIPWIVVKKKSLSEDIEKYRYNRLCHRLFFSSSRMTFWKKCIDFSNKNSVKYAVPFLILMIAGSFGLKEFAQLRYTFSKKQPISSEDLKKYGITMKKTGEVTLETEFEKIKTLDIDNWENKRGPRPWEENFNVEK